jgi:hypothetical protein
VTALHPDSRDRRGFTPVSVKLRSLSNERGEFRLDVSRGEFYVIAFPRHPSLDTNKRVNRAGYANTFYPAAVRFQDAQRVRVATADPVHIDITLAPARLSVITGTVIASTGQPVRGGRLAVAPGDGFFGHNGREVPIRDDGAFAVPALQPGTYHLHYRESEWPPPRGTIPVVSVAKVVVTDADVTGVRVAPLQMVRTTGRVIVDADARAALQPSTVRIGATPLDFDGNPGPTRGGQVQEDLTFELRTWPGKGRIRVALPSPEWSVKAVRLHGVDVTDTPLDFVEGKGVSNLEIHLVRRPRPWK